MYAAWRIQEFWLLFGISFALSITFSFLLVAIGGFEVDGGEYYPYFAFIAILAFIGIDIMIRIILVEKFAKKYNERVGSITPLGE